MTLQQRFWSKVDAVPSGCWEWTASTANGYGRVGGGGKGKGMLYAHRVAWILAHGVLPDGLWVLHRCDNRRCVNPSHLFLGTRRDNIDDAVSKGRQARGAMLPQTKLTVGDVIEIRTALASGVSRTALASRFGVGRATLRDLAERVTWRHV